MAELFKLSELAQARSAHAGIIHKIEGWQTQAASSEGTNTEINELSTVPLSRVRNRDRINELSGKVEPKVLKKQGLEANILAAQPELKRSTESMNLWVGSVETSTQKLTNIEGRLDTDAVNRGRNIWATTWSPTAALETMIEPTSKNLGAWTRTAGIIEQTGIATGLTASIYRRLNKAVASTSVVFAAEPGQEIPEVHSGALGWRMTLPKIQHEGCCWT